MDETLLGQVPLFASLPREELQHLALTLRQFEIAPGTVLLREGDYGVLQRRTRAFSYARAGHEQPIVAERHGLVSMPELGLGHPLGIVPDPALDEQTVRFLLEACSCSIPMV